MYSKIMKSQNTDCAIQGMNDCETRHQTALSAVALRAGHILSELIDDPLFLIDLIAKSGQLLVMEAARRFTLQADSLLKEKCPKAQTILSKLGTIKIKHVKHLHFGIRPQL